MFSVRYSRRFLGNVPGSIPLYGAHVHSHLVLLRKEDPAVRLPIAGGRFRQNYTGELCYER